MQHPFLIYILEAIFISLIKGLIKILFKLSISFLGMQLSSISKIEKEHDLSKV